MLGEHLQVVHGDITRMEVDAIVNAANSELLGGGGVDGAIHGRGGPAIREACKEIRDKKGGCPTGEAKATTAGNLPARYVVHTVGPVWRGGGEREDELLASCHRNVLEVAAGLGCATVSFPAISTGAFGYPVDRAARIALGSTAATLEGLREIERVTFVLFDRNVYEEFEAALNELRASTAGPPSGRAAPPSGR